MSSVFMPAIGLAVPGGHSMHSDWPYRVLYVPGAHRMHDSLAAGLL